MLMGKSREVLQLVKHFWFFTAKQYCSFLLQLQWMGTFFKMCLETLEPKQISRGYLDPFQRRNINLTRMRCNDPSASVALL